MIDRHVERGKLHACREFSGVASATVGAEEQDSRTCHARGPEKRLDAAVLVLTVNQCNARTHAHERSARAFPIHPKVGSVPSEFDSSANQRGGKGIGGKNQNGVTRHDVIRIEAASRRGVAGIAPSAQEQRHGSLIRE